MVTVKTNSLNLCVLLFLFTFEISFTKSLELNFFIVLLCVVYLIKHKKWYGLVGLFLLPLIPALSTFWSVMVHGSGSTDAWLLFSRTFAFAALGMMFAFGIDLEELLLVLEQKKVPTSFVYGILVVLHAVSDIKEEVKGLKDASLLRGKRLTIFSPLFYLKTIFVAFDWRDHYSEAIKSRGYDDSTIRKPSTRYITPKHYFFVSVVIFIIGNSLLFISF